MQATATRRGASLVFLEVVSRNTRQGRITKATLKLTPRFAKFDSFEGGLHDPHQPPIIEHLP